MHDVSKPSCVFFSPTMYLGEVDNEEFDFDMEEVDPHKWEGKVKSRLPV